MLIVGGVFVREVTIHKWRLLQHLHFLRRVECKHALVHRMDHLIVDRWHERHAELLVQLTIWHDARLLGSAVLNQVLGQVDDDQ